METPNHLNTHNLIAFEGAPGDADIYLRKVVGDTLIGRVSCGLQRVAREVVRRINAPAPAPQGAAPAPGGEEAALEMVAERLCGLRDYLGPERTRAIKETLDLVRICIRYPQAPVLAAPAPGGVEASDLRLVEAAGQLVADLDALISDSKGVAGLHLNGDVAEWDDLQRGGRFESWLSSLDALRDLLDKLAEGPQGAPQEGEALGAETRADFCYGAWKDARKMKPVLPEVNPNDHVHNLYREAKRLEGEIRKLRAQAEGRAP